jgi:hypothetical protein
MQKEILLSTKQCLTKKLKGQCFEQIDVGDHYMVYNEQKKNIFFIQLKICVYGEYDEQRKQPGT